MSHSQVVGISAGCAIFGGGLLLFVFFAVSPQGAGGEPNTAAIVAFVISAALVVGGLGALFIRAVHHRRALAVDEYDERKSRQPIMALRQGAFIAIGVAIVLTLAYYGILDPPYFIATFVTLGLIEVFIQYRR